MLPVIVAAAVWVAAFVLALALCRPAAAGDRAMLDAELIAARKAHSELPMSLGTAGRAKGQRKRREIAAARGPDAPGASSTPHARVRAT